MMSKIDVSWKIFGVYLLVLILVCVCGKASGQISVSQFNASWNSANEVSWVNDLSDCQTLSYVDIAEAKTLPEALPPDVTRMEFDMKDQMIRATIMETKKDVDEMKKTLERIEDKLYKR